MVSEKKKDFTVVGLGEVLWDFLPEGKQLGGAPANFIYHTQSLGAQGLMVSATGNDELGQQIRDRVTALNFDVHYIAIDKEHPTGTVSVTLDDKGNPE